MAHRGSQDEEMDPAEVAGDGFMVAHGYLSDDEGVRDEDDEMGDGVSKARQVDKNDLSDTAAGPDKGRAAPAPPKCYVWQLRHCFGPFLTYLSSMSSRPRRMACSTYRPCASVGC